MVQNVTDIGHRPDAPNGAWSVPDAQGLSRMGRVSFEVRHDVKTALEAKAKSLGISLAAYARKLVLDGSKRDPQSHHTELRRSIRALLEVLVYAMGRMQKRTPEESQQWVEVMLGYYDKQRGGA